MLDSLSSETMKYNHAYKSSSSSHITMGLTFCSLFLKTKFRNRAMLFDETLIVLFWTLISFYKDILLGSLKCFIIKKNVFFLSISTQILEPVFVQWHNI